MLSQQCHLRVQHGTPRESDRELYYDNAQSLGDKYALVNNDGLRGIGIWALGYNFGSSDLWNAISTSFSVAHGPSTVPTAPGPGIPVGLGGGPLGGAPQAVSWGPNFDDVFWGGTDDGLWHMWEIDGQWYGPASLSGPGVMASDPSVVSWGAGEIDVFFKGGRRRSLARLLRERQLAHRPGPGHGTPSAPRPRR